MSSASSGMQVGRYFTVTTLHGDPATKCNYLPYLLYEELLLSWPFGQRERIVIRRLYNNSDALEGIEKVGSGTQDLVGISLDLISLRRGSIPSAFVYMLEDHRGWRPLESRKMR